MLLTLPKIRNVSSYQYISYKNQKNKLTTEISSIILPLSDCDVMLNTLDKYNNKHNAVRITNQIYLKEHLQSMVKLHELHDLQRKVEEEKKNGQRRVGTMSQRDVKKWMKKT